VQGPDDIDAVLGPSGRLARGMARYEHRPAQLDFARAVQASLLRDELLIAEAGTGTGKTIAYLVPALLSGKKVVVSTGTRTLQDQILAHDLPLLTAAMSEPPAVASMKGLHNYLCLRRYREFRSSAAAVASPSAAQLPMLQDWLERTDEGDRAELGLPDDAPIWAEVQSGPDSRIGPRCRDFDACYVTRMRARAQAAQVVVVNHHLFFADLLLRSGKHGSSVIPDYDAVIFDEAHLIEDIATQFFGVSVSNTRLSVLLRDAARTLDFAGLAQESQRLIAQAGEVGAAFFTALPRAFGPDNARIPLSIEHVDQRLRQPLFALDNALDGLSALCKRHADISAAVVQIARRTDQLRDDVVLIADGGGRGRVCFTESRGRSVSLGASPVDVAAILREQLFYRGLSVVLTSATLSANGSFEFLRSRLGIDDDARQLSFASPFDYPSQAALYLPAHLPDPREPSYPAEVEREIAELIALTDGGAFVLCTSLRMMRSLCASLRRSTQRNVWMQGEMPSATLLERFRADGRGVLIASTSFWQGVDVPGPALRLVIIDKLPFDVPTDPLVAARCDRLKQQGQQPFMKYLVPAAALALKQAFGRLIRSRRDHGIVAILDSRMTRKGYGRVLERSLPDATRCQTFAQVSAFWRALPALLTLLALGDLRPQLARADSGPDAATPALPESDRAVQRALAYQPDDPLGELESADALDRIAGTHPTLRPGSGKPKPGACVVIEPAQRIWPSAGPSAIASVGQSFVVAGYAVRAGKEQLFVVRATLGAKPEPITAFDVDPPYPRQRSAAPGLSARAENDISVAFVNATGQLWVRRLRMGRAGHGAAIELASGVDTRLAPAVAHRQERTLVAWTAATTPMHTWLALISNDDAVLSRTDLTPSSMGASAPAFVAGASPPALVAVDARNGMSPILRIDLASDGSPGKAKVAVPVSMVSSPPRLAAGVSSAGSFVAYTGLGAAATSAVGLVAIDEPAARPITLVPGTAYGSLHVAAASSPQALYFAVDAPVTGGKGTAGRDPLREVRVHVLGQRGLGAATSIRGPGSSTRPSIALSREGNVAVSFTTETGVYVAHLRCDAGG
jgi:ATP-dependent DNA helicase DinG